MNLLKKPMNLPLPLWHKLKQLETRLIDMKGVLVAFSGGTDSTLLLKIASDVLVDRVLAVTAVSEIYPERETQAACDMAEQLRVKHQVLRTNELSEPKFAENSSTRCYHCKTILFSKLFEIADAHRLGEVVDGAHLDDQDDFRPGRKAAKELGIHSPLADAEFRKADIRTLSEHMGLPTWNKLPQPCLSTRFPYGTEITVKRLDRVSKAEAFLYELGFRQLRLRVHDNIARLEVLPEEMTSCLELRETIIQGLKSLGYVYVTLDLEGYRTGSLNEVLKIKKAE